MPSAFRRSGGSSKTRIAPISESSSNGPSNRPFAVKSTTVRPLRGVKPWQGGFYLTSVGLNDLDSILGGGQVLGTSIVLEEDRLWTRDLATTLVKYWCAEAISQDHHLVVPLFSTSLPEDDNDEDFLFGDDLDDRPSMTKLREELCDLLSSLPRNLHWDKQKKKEEKAKREQEAVDAAGATDALSSMNLGPMTILEEDDEEDEDETADDGLEVAWQYKKSVQQERLAKSKSSTVTTTGVALDVFCHSYDLSARMVDQKPIDPSVYIASVSVPPGRSDNHTKAYRLFTEVVRLLKERKGDNKAIRLLLYHPPMEVLAIALPLLVAHIRKESLPVVILICNPPTMDLNSKIRLSRSCDVVVSTEGFAARKEYPPPAEFRHLQGILKIAKTTRKRTEMAANIYGFKRDRRKLHIPLLHIPPEDYAEGGGSTGGVRSGAGRPTKSSEGGSVSETLSARKPSGGGGMGCSSNRSGSLLDF
jgi:hypothetical protein